MLERIRKATEDKERGFTLIELLVVVIIIGILAAIAIPTFLNQRQNGYKAQAQSDVRNAATAIESWAADRNGSYQGMDTTILVGTATTPGLVKASSGVTLSVATTPAASATEFCVNADHSSLTNPSGQAADFHFKKSVGSPQPGACA